MKVFVAHFSAECNEHIDHTVPIEEFYVLYGKESVEAMHVSDIFKENNIDVVPSIYANLPPGGMIQKDAYEFIKNKILSTLKNHISEIDGIYLQLHGASGIVGLDCISGEHDLIVEIRKITGKYMPIAVSMDPHGNITERYTSMFNIVRCYRESPHSDSIDTKRLVAYKLIDLMKNRRVMKPIFRKLPILVGGERSISAHEPIRTINQMLDKAEEDSRVFSSSYNVGYIRHDDDKLGAAIVVVPNTPNDISHCEKVIDEICEYTWNHRHEFKFRGNYDEYEVAVEKAINYPEKTVVITDSGDNCGAGGAGHNTQILAEILKHKTDKKILIAGINDRVTHASLSGKNINDYVEIDLGENKDSLSRPVHIKGTIRCIGNQTYGLNRPQVVGNAYTINVENTNVDVIVMNRNIQYGCMPQFEQAGLNFHDYDIVIVKMGYLDTYLIPETTYHIMALTDGPTIQRSERIPFKLIARPMWPMDEFDELYYIDTK